MSACRVGVLHTLFGLVDGVRKQFSELLPGVELVNIVDDSLLSEALAHGVPTSGVMRRMCGYYHNFQEIGCCCVLTTCSTVGEVSEQCQAFVDIPLLRIDVPMAEACVQSGRRVAVIATASSTLGPSVRLVENVARRLGRDVCAEAVYVDDAYDLLLKKGDRCGHDALVLDAIRRAADDHDAVMLAQGSMYGLQDRASAMGVPVFASLQSGVEQIRHLIPG